MINDSIIYKFFKDFTNHRKETNMVVVFSCRLFPNILKYRYHHQWNLPAIWKTSICVTNILPKISSLPSLLDTYLMEMEI